MHYQALCILSRRHSCLYVVDKEQGWEVICLLPEVRARVEDKDQVLEDKKRGMRLLLHRVVTAGM